MSSQPASSSVSIDPVSLSRLPALPYEALDEDGRRFHDAVVRAQATLLAGFQGPSGIWMNMPKIGLLLQQVNQLLRNQTPLDKRQVEIAILVTAHEMKSRFEWDAHEKVALGAGVAGALIDVIRHDADTACLAESDGVMVEMGREVFREGRVSDATYARALSALGQTALFAVAALFSNYAMTAVVLGVFDQQSAASLSGRADD